MKPNCSCMEMTIQRLKEFYPNYTHVYFDDMDLLSGRLTNSVTIEMGKMTLDKKKKHIIVTHAYCPFCGKKYAANKELKQ